MAKGKEHIVYVIVDGKINHSFRDMVNQGRKAVDELDIGGRTLSKTFLQMGANADFSLGSMVNGFQMVNSGAVSAGSAVGSFGLGLAASLGSAAVKAGIEAVKWGLRETVDTIKDGVVAAAEFEDAMINVSKVTPGMRDDATGGYTELYDQYKSDIIELGIQLPKIDEYGVAQLYADAARAGVGDNLSDEERRDELREFVEMTAKHGLAMQMTPEQAGGYNRYFYGKMGMSIPEIAELGDLVNKLDDKSIAEGKAILQVLANQGAFSEMANLDVKKQAMLATVLGAGGEGEGDPNTVATTMENLVKRLSGGAAQGSKMYENALKAIGRTKGETQTSMYKDPMGTIIDILKDVSSLKENRVEVMSGIAGAQALPGLSFIMKAMETGMFDKMYAIMTEKDYIGSVEREYGFEAGTFNARKEEMQARWDAFLIQIGEPFMDGLSGAWDANKDVIIGAINRITPKFGDLADTVFAEGGLADKIIELLPAAASAIEGFIDVLIAFVDNPVGFIFGKLSPNSGGGGGGEGGEGKSVVDEYNEMTVFEKMGYGPGGEPFFSADGNIFSQKGLTWISEYNHPEAVVPLTPEGISRFTSGLPRPWSTPFEEEPELAPNAERARQAMKDFMALDLTQIGLPQVQAAQPSQSQPTPPVTFIYQGNSATEKEARDFGRWSFDEWTRCWEQHERDTARTAW